MRQHFIYFLMLLLSAGVSAQVGINNPNPHASAALDVTSTTQGFLPPRMTEAQRDAIASPAQGLMVYCSDCGPSGEPQYYDGTAWVNMVGGSATSACGYATVTFTYNGNEVTYGTVESTGNKCWLDRNLGATQVATSSTDEDAYGDLFQWGRLDDGHQVRTSPTTTTLSTTDVPGHGNFILPPNSPIDWRSPQNDNLWQGVSGINNPCPDGYRLPTEAEWNTERESWSINNNAAGAFASPLKLPVAGHRGSYDGLLGDVGTFGYYWSSTVTGSSSWTLLFGSFAGMYEYHRALGGSVRCLKD